MRAPSRLDAFPTESDLEQASGGLDGSDVRVLLKVLLTESNTKIKLGLDTVSSPSQGIAGAAHREKIVALKLAVAAARWPAFFEALSRANGPRLLLSWYATLLSAYVPSVSSHTFRGSSSSTFLLTRSRQPRSFHASEPYRLHPLCVSAALSTPNLLQAPLLSVF